MTSSNDHHIVGSIHKLGLAPSHCIHPPYRIEKKKTYRVPSDTVANPRLLPSTFNWDDLGSNPQRRRATERARKAICERDGLERQGGRGMWKGEKLGNSMLPQPESHSLLN